LFRSRADISVFPLAFPFIAGPGALATILLWFGPVHLTQQPAVFAGYLAAVLLVLVIALMMMLLADPLMAAIGITGANVAGRLLGVILGALAVQFVLDGLRQAFGGSCRSGAPEGEIPHLVAEPRATPLEARRFALRRSRHESAVRGEVAQLRAA